jgi:hypothetical protein
MSRNKGYQNKTSNRYRFLIFKLLIPCSLLQGGLFHLLMAPCMFNASYGANSRYMEQKEHKRQPLGYDFEAVICEKLAK